MNVVKLNNENTLFFVSGMFAGGWMWQDTYPKIPNASRCYIMSEPLSELGGSVGELSDKIIEALTKIDEPVTLVGNSLGSYVCMNVAALEPDRVSRVIISGSAGFGEAILPIRLSRHNAMETARKLGDLIMFDRDLLPAEIVERTAEVFRDNLRNIAGLMRESNALRAVDILPNIRCPIHAIWGRDDVITPLSETLEAFKQFDISLNIINQCGHSPMYEKPTEFAALVNSCLPLSKYLQAA
ncbi:MAG: alpha/beta hydrolase [Gammaproteobacteria bacterium]|nr:alpha/beta hydrolase [Gammaproteobacteria bacterium]